MYLPLWKMVLGGPRRDSKYRTERCRYRSRMEDAKFQLSVLPVSGVVGVTFSRIRRRWEVRIPEVGDDGKRWLNYVGSAATISDALQIRREVMGGGWWVRSEK